jgi:hypothetical protein
MLGKVTSNFARLTDFEDLVDNLKAGQGCLLIIINRVQTKLLKVGDKMPLESQQPQPADLPPEPSIVGSKVEVLLNTPSTSFAFPTTMILMTHRQSMRWRRLDGSLDAYNDKFYQDLTRRNELSEP